MEVFSDKFGRRIWFNVSDSILHFELLDINENSEYERSASVRDLTQLCHRLNCKIANLETVLFDRFGGSVNSFDLLADFLTENNIQYGYYSGTR